MFNQAPDLFLSALPPPKKLLHYVCFFCLVGWGVSATVVASHGGIHAAWLQPVCSDLRRRTQNRGLLGTQ